VPTGCPGRTGWPPELKRSEAGPSIGPLQPHPPGRPTQTAWPLGFLLFQLVAKAIGTAERRRIVLGLLAKLALQALHTLLDQHPGHVAHGAGFAIGQKSQPLTQLLGQHHLNPGGLGPAAGGGLAGGHNC
jgi:hypothetical protein